MGELRVEVVGGPLHLAHVQKLVVANLDHLLQGVQQVGLLVVLLPVLHLEVHSFAPYQILRLALVPDPLLDLHFPALSLGTRRTTRHQTGDGQDPGPWHRGRG